MLRPGAALALLLLPAVASWAETTRYAVKLRADLERRVLHGEEVVTLDAEAGTLRLRKRQALAVVRFSGGELSEDGDSVQIRLARGGRQELRFEFTAAAGPGLRWFAEAPGFFTAFDCGAWMICDDSPAERARLELEIALPLQSGLQAVGPGRLRKSWQDGAARHFLFEQADPVQTYLWSFAAARLRESPQGRLSVYAEAAGHASALQKTASAETFFRDKAGTDRPTRRYAQVFLPERGLGQEAVGLALMSEAYLARLEKGDDVYLMAHELAHQWWGVLVGIRSWSDFWLNEGMAAFMADAFIERHQGRAAYDRRIAERREELARLQKEGKDRPLHFEGWKTATEALGPIPYCKGELFLDRLRAELGEPSFWRGLALYTSRHARALVDSHDLQRAMEQASGRSLAALFDEAVYR
ncbi:MAG TPA: M1 family aminopeptidase [Vicinamibacteria bacterium]|jgi:aminopeptidase N